MKAIKGICLILLLTFALSACKESGHICPTAISASTFPLIESVKAYPGPGNGQLPTFETFKTTDQDEQQTISKYIAGERVTGTYLYSTRNTLDMIRTNVYQTQDGHLFGSDSEGILRFCTWNIEESATTVLTEQQCQKVAKDFLTPYVKLDHYKITVDRKENGIFYVFTFTKYYGDHPTVDQAVVTVHQSGQLSAYRSTMFGRLPDQADAPVDEAKIKDLIDQKIASMYPNISTSRSEPVFIYHTAGDLYCLVDIKLLADDTATEEQLVFYIYLR